MSVWSLIFKVMSATTTAKKKGKKCFLSPCNFTGGVSAELLRLKNLLAYKTKASVEEFFSTAIKMVSSFSPEYQGHNFRP